VLVDRIEKGFARRRHHRPEGDPRRATRRDAQAPAQGEHWIQHRADSVRQASPVDRRDGVADVVAAAEETGAVGLYLDVTDRFAFDDREMGGPQLGLVRAAATARRQDGARGQQFGLYEHLGEGLVRCIGQWRRQHDLGVGGDLDVTRRTAGIGDRHATDLGVVLRRDHDVDGPS